MKRFAGVANAGASHLMAMCAIGRELQRLGHEFVLFGTSYQAAQLRVSDIPFHTLAGDAQDPVRSYVDGARAAGTVSISDTVAYMKEMANLLCTELPPLFREAAIDLVLADQEEPGAATAADLSGLPYVSVCNSLPLNEAADVPPGFLPWSYSDSAFARLRNRFGYAIRNMVVGRVNSVLNVHRRKANLKPYRRPDDSFSARAQITQLVPEFDFPRGSPVPGLRYVGPFQRQPLFPVAFPYERLDGRPIVYASLGTSFGTRSRELQTVAAACSELPVQLVIALGGVQPDASQAELPGQPIVVSYAPQRDLLSRAAIAITHGGLNTTMEALSLGVPLLAVPLAGDQVGVAARIRWGRVGRSVGPHERSAPKIKAAVSDLLHDEATKRAAQSLAVVIQQSGGAAQAARIIEDSLP